jgi:hypothetical protein
LVRVVRVAAHAGLVRPPRVVLTRRSRT